MLKLLIGLLLVIQVSAQSDQDKCFCYCCPGNSFNFIQFHSILSPQQRQTHTDNKKDVIQRVRHCQVVFLLLLVVATCLVVQRHVIHGSIQSVQLQIKSAIQVLHQCMRCYSLSFNHELCVVHVVQVVVYSLYQMQTMDKTSLLYWVIRVTVK